MKVGIMDDGNATNTNNDERNTVQEHQHHNRHDQHGQTQVVDNGIGRGQRVDRLVGGNVEFQTNVGVLFFNRGNPLPNQLAHSTALASDCF